MGVDGKTGLLVHHMKYEMSDQGGTSSTIAQIPSLVDNLQENI